MDRVSESVTDRVLNDEKSSDLGMTLERQSESREDDESLAGWKGKKAAAKGLGPKPALKQRTGRRLARKLSSTLNRLQTKGAGKAAEPQTAAQSPTIP